MRRFQPLLNMLGSNITTLNGTMTPDSNKFNRDIGLELPWCWLSMLCANHPLGYNNSMHYPPVILLFTLCLLYYQESSTSVDP